jgi:hypothetical protein
MIFPWIVPAPFDAPERLIIKGLSLLADADGRLAQSVNALAAAVKYLTSAQHQPSR